jgi:hypothetical protein
VTSAKPPGRQRRPPDGARTAPGPRPGQVVSQPTLAAALTRLCADPHREFWQ